MIAVPAYKDLCAEFVYSLWDTQKALEAHDICADLVILAGGCHVDDNRNHLMQVFIDSDCTDLMMIDDDTRWNALDLVRLVLSNKDFIAGIAPKKTYPLDFACRLLPGATGLAHPVGASGVGAAFLKLSRAAVVRMAAVSEKYTLQVKGGSVTVPLLFERTIADGSRWGGDYSFCNKWRALGGRIYVEPDIILGHIGHNEWVGSLGRQLRQENDTSDAYMAAIVHRMMDGKSNTEDFINLRHEWGNEDWPAPVDLLQALWLLAKEVDGPILECGSGLSSIVLGASGKDVVALEHDKSWFERMCHLKSLFGLDSFGIHYAPIHDGWYHVNRQCEVGWSMIVVDGPPRSQADRGNVVDFVRTAPGCVWVVDDVLENQTVLQRIADRFGVEFHPFGRYAIGKQLEEKHHAA